MSREKTKLVSEGRTLGWRRGQDSFPTSRRSRSPRSSFTARGRPQGWPQGRPRGRESCLLLLCSKADILPAGLRLAMLFLSGTGVQPGHRVPFGSAGRDSLGHLPVALRSCSEAPGRRESRIRAAPLFPLKAEMALP